MGKKIKTEKNRKKMKKKRIAQYFTVNLHRKTLTNFSFFLNNKRNLISAFFFSFFKPK
jgi:hypothetical protein